MPKKDKYTKEQRWEIGRQLYYNEISRQEAVEKYGVNVYTIRYYMRHYRDANKLPPKVPYGEALYAKKMEHYRMLKEQAEREQQLAEAASDNVNE